jgi:hypothetical protein
MTVTPDFFYGVVTNALSHQEEADRIPTAEACVVFLGQMATGQTASAYGKWAEHFNALGGLYEQGIATIEASR